MNCESGYYLQCEHYHTELDEGYNTAYCGQEAIDECPEDCVSYEEGLTFGRIYGGGE